MRQGRSPQVLPLHVSDVSFPAGHPQEGQRGPVYAFAVVAPDGVLLFDTGVGEGEPRIDEGFHPVRRSLREELTAHAIDPQDVTLVANSHLHFDHCGWNALFPGRPIYVRGDEYRAARRSGYTVQAWFDFPNSSYQLLEGDQEVKVLSGVRLIPTPGHTPGHQSLVIQTFDGPVVVAGQAVYTAAEWDGSSDPQTSGELSAWNRQTYAESVGRLRALDPVMVLFSHDLRIWERA